MFELKSIFRNLINYCDKFLSFLINLMGPSLDASTLETVEALNAFSFGFLGRWAMSAFLIVTNCLKNKSVLSSSVDQDRINSETDVVKALTQAGQIDARDADAVARALAHAGRCKTVSEAFSSDFSHGLKLETKKSNDFQSLSSVAIGSLMNSEIRQVDSVKYLSQKSTQRLKPIRTNYGYLRIIDYNDGSKSYEIFQTGPCAPCRFKDQDFEGAFVVSAENPKGKTK